MSTYVVKTAASKDHQRLLSVNSEAGKESFFKVGRFALVGPGDRIKVKSAGPTRNVLLESKSDGGWIPVEPTYHHTASLKIGGQRFALAVGELETPDQLLEYNRLENFHYRGRVLDEGPDGEADAAKGTGGRKAVLLISVNVGDRNRVVGYIELQMPLMMCKPRHDLFVLPFQHPTRDIAWSKWLGDGQKHVNLIVRIARVVVDPEFRGLGLSSMLVEHAKLFAKERWSIGGQRPLFIEISAEMLRYIDFVSKAGLKLIGQTEGNLARISQDLKSVENGASGNSQIMSLQKKYHAAFSSYCKNTQRSFDEAVVVLAELLSAADPRSKMPSDEWLAFRPLLRFPIPYHLAGLDEHSELYVQKCLNEKRARESALLATAQPRRGRPKKATLSPDVMAPEIKASGVEVWVDHSLKLSPYVRLAMDSFGIDSPRIRNKLVGPVDFDLVGGNIAFITGSSGAGKSVLLTALTGLPDSHGLTIKGTISGKDRVVAKLEPLPENTPLLQYFGKKYGPEAAFDALCRVGLSEAMVFIKPFSLLSMGQRYRAMLADLLLSKATIWLIDEFCANLDPVTAAVIAGQIRRLARRLQVVVVAAAANSLHFIDSLAPDVIYVVRTGGDVKQLSPREFRNGFYEKGL